MADRHTLAAIYIRVVGKEKKAAMKWNKTPRDLNDQNRGYSQRVLV